MSKNLKSQDEAEQKCLDEVISKFNSKDCFGMEKEEEEYLRNILTNARLNDYGTTFPDFIVDNGFIEHFEVTSSLENKKGAKQKKESIKFAKESEKQFSDIIDNTSEDEYKSLSFQKKFEEHNQQYIRQSIKKNWDNHIKSYEKFEGDKENSVFLLEYSDFGTIETAELVSDGSGIVYRSYRVTLDKGMLDWIYPYKDKIKYFILHNNQSTEFVRVDKIPEFKKKLPEGMVCATFGFETHSYQPLGFTLN